MKNTYRKYDPSTWVAGGRVSEQFAAPASTMTPEDEAWIAESVAKNPSRFGNPTAKNTPSNTPEENAWLAEKYGGGADKISKMADKLINERPEDDEPEDFIGQITK